MGTITSGVGLVSGLNTANIISQLMELEARPRTLVQRQVTVLTSQQAAFADINARLQSLRIAAADLGRTTLFDTKIASSSNNDAATVTANSTASTGTYQLTVSRLVATQQQISRGFVDSNATAVGSAATLRISSSKASLARDVKLADLNGQAGFSRGKIRVIDRSGGSVEIDLTRASTLTDVVDTINSASGILVTASIGANGLVLTDSSGGGGNFIVQNVGLATTATSLGLVSNVASSTITGAQINKITAGTLTSYLNDGLGVRTTSSANQPDLRITDHNGANIDVNLGRLTDGKVDYVSGSIRITDSVGSAAIIDLSNATTLAEIVTAINGASISVTASDSGGALKIVDTGGGAENLVIEDSGSTSTATSLGIKGIFGDEVSKEKTGTGLQLKTTPPARTVQEIITRINAAAVAAGSSVVASISGDQQSLTLTDAAPYVATELTVTSLNGTQAARDLGFTTGDADHDGVLQGGRLIASLGSSLLKNLNGGRGIGSSIDAAATNLSSLRNGAGLPSSGDATEEFSITDKLGNVYNIDIDPQTTLQALITAVNTATGGNVTLSVVGDRLKATDTTGGAGSLSLASINGNTTLEALGLNFTGAAGVGDGTYALSSGLAPATFANNDAGPGTISITNRAGATTAIDLSSAASVDDLLGLINGAGAGVTASRNTSGNGITLTDSSGGVGNLFISDVSGSAAANLKIATSSAGVASSTIESGDLNLRHVSETTKLSALNNGQGINRGKFIIIDSAGNSVAIDLTQGNEEDLNDVIAEINSLAQANGVLVAAAINQTGDGLVIRDSAAGSGLLQVLENGSTTADGLNILGSDTVGNGYIDGTSEITISISSTDTLDNIVKKINDAKPGVSAAVINDGSAGDPFRLSLTSDQSGLNGAFLLDDGGLGLNLSTLVEARDAEVLLGSSTNPNQALFISSSSNTLTTTIPGLTINLIGASTAPTTISVKRDDSAVISAVNQFVTNFNTVQDKISELDKYDSEKNQRSLLLGDPTLARIRRSLNSLLTTRVAGAPLNLSLASQVGLRIGEKNNLTFDESVLRSAIQTNFDGVRSLFTRTQIVTTAPTVIVAGITAGPATSSVKPVGLGKLFDDIIGKMTNSIDGSITLTTNSLSSQIELGNKRIADLNTLLGNKRARLELQFSNLETALSKLQSQQASLASLASAASGVR